MPLFRPPETGRHKDSGKSQRANHNAVGGRHRHCENEKHIESRRLGRGSLQEEILGTLDAAGRLDGIPDA